jgi:putative protease
LGDTPLPLLGAAALNGLRRALADALDAQPCRPRPLYSPARPSVQPGPSENPEKQLDPLMRSKYCIRFELGRCPVHQGAKNGGTLYLLNNGRRLKLQFDCKSCEMQVNKN